MKYPRVTLTGDLYKSHWHLGPIGVHPLLQGRGIGKSLLRSFLEMSDEQELPAYLETDVDLNVSLHEKFFARQTKQTRGNDGRKFLDGVSSTT